MQKKIQNESMLIKIIKMSGKVLIYPHKHEKITLYLHIYECPFLPVDWSQFPIMAIKPIFYIVSFQLLFLMKKTAKRKVLYQQVARSERVTSMTAMTNHPAYSPAIPPKEPYLS